MATNYVLTNDQQRFWNNRTMTGATVLRYERRHFFMSKNFNANASRNRVKEKTDITCKLYNKSHKNTGTRILHEHLHTLYQCNSGSGTERPKLTENNRENTVIQRQYKTHYAVHWLYFVGKRTIQTIYGAKGRLDPKQQPLPSITLHLISL